MQLENKNMGFILKILICVIAFITIVYIGGYTYYRSHMFLGTTINGINVSNKTIEEAKSIISDEVKNYKLDIVSRDCSIQTISGAEISLEYNTEELVNKVSKSQESWAWLSFILGGCKYEINELVTFDEDRLIEKYDDLPFFDESKVIKPKSASFEFNKDRYIIVDEIIGNSVKKDIFYSYIVSSINTGKESLDIDDTNCYDEPKFTANSKEAILVKNTLNKMVSSKITYKSKNQNIVLDGKIISTWLTVNEDFAIVINEKMIKEYVNSLGEIYNTVGQSREFKSSSGKTIFIDGGDYGTAIDTIKETSEIVSMIKNGTVIEREPLFSQRVNIEGINDIGNTYVEINFERQYLWFYRDGKLIVEGSIVSGNESRGFKTPTGIYSLKFKQKDVVLKGPGYESKVQYWMPFNGGVGIHDATWRGDFGGTIYKTNGSHGCVNAPTYLAQTIYQHIEDGTPIVCYK